MTTQEKFSGCLIGQCLGDALGCLVEGRSPTTCGRHVEKTLARWHADPPSREDFYGQYTDDSQLAREFLQSYLACRGFDPADYARRIAAIFKEGRIVGQGRSTAEAAGRLNRGVPWDQAGTPGPVAGNGSAMRAGPVGLLFHDDPGEMVRVAHDQGRITHQDPRCSAGAVAIAGAVALVLRGGTIDVPAFLGQLGAWAEPFEPSVAGFLRRLAGLVPLPPEEVAPLISRAGMDPGYHDGWQGISPFVTPTVLWGLYAFLRSPDDYWQTICTAIAVGGDVDTTAAIAGAVSGAYLGLSALPAHLARHVTDQGTWNFGQLVELAHQCHALKEQNPRAPQ